MKPEIKDSWTAALRSGEYQQGRGALRTGDQFCCLGVLCDLHAKATGGQWSDLHDARSGYVLPQRYCEAEICLPTEVLVWAGLSLATHLAIPVGPHPHAGLHLADVNDSQVPFPEIADLIDRHL